MRYIFKELQRHYWRTIFSITGYAIAAVFILIILCITGSNKTDSFGILQSLEIPLSQYIEFRFQYTDIPLLYSLSVVGAFFASIFPIIKIHRSKTGDIINNHL